MTNQTKPAPPSSDKNANIECDNIKQDCPLKKGTLIVLVLDQDGNPIKDVTVEVNGLGNKLTEADGTADFGSQKEGDYTAKGEKDGCLPAKVEKKGTLVAQTTSVIELKLKTKIIHMHLDADRDGAVDADWKGLDTWEWGAGKKGAIILCNNDDDDNASTLDNADDKINGGNDKDEIAPLVIRMEGGSPPPSTFKAELSVSAADAKRIRIFDSKAAGGKEIIGPTKGKTYKFPDLNFTEKALGMEALEYAGDGFDGEISLKFSVSNTAGKDYDENAKIRVAPWMIPNHKDPATKVYVVNAGNSNRRFRNELKTHASAAGCSLDESHASNDIWMQDCMEIGFSCLPNHAMTTVTRPPRGRGLELYPKSLLAPNFGYTEVGIVDPNNTFNSTGNLEVTPPTQSQAGKDFPFGRIYYGPGRLGDLIDPEFKAFLNKQIVQKPIEVDTSWLLVGHVDELMTFVPSTGGKGFKMLLASPKLAYKILKDNKAAHGGDKLLTNRYFNKNKTSKKAEVTIKDFLDTGIPGLGALATASSLDTFNKAKQLKLDAIKKQFEKEIGINPVTDVIEVPIIFMPSPHGPAYADALTTGMVNMLVLNKHCIIPKPFGPVVGGKDLFEEDLKTKLTALGLTVKYIDDWYEYHINLGEVHCGTNTLRTAPKTKWWEFTP